MTSPDEKQQRDRMQRLETLVQKVEELDDPKARSITRELIQLLMDLHGTGLEKLLGLIYESHETGGVLIDALATDRQVSGLMLLHGLHPVDLESRVHEALASVRPYLASHGGNVELLSIDDGVVRLRLQGSCHGCPSSAMTLKSTIEEAILEKAPDAAGIAVEGEITTVEEPVHDQANGNGNGHGHFALPILAGS